jgi:hypothetical protein
MRRKNTVRGGRNRCTLPLSHVIEGPGKKCWNKTKHKKRKHGAEELLNLRLETFSPFGAG